MTRHVCPQCGSTTHDNAAVVLCGECFEPMRRVDEPEGTILQSDECPERLRPLARMMVDNGRKPAW